MEERIRQAVEKALTAVGSEATFAVEWPSDPTHGDYATNAAMVAAKALGKNPKVLAEELAPRIANELGSFASSVSVAGPGFINMVLSAETVRAGIESATEEAWGKGNAKENKRVSIEYACPNPFKEMHVGHLMSTVIGEAVARTVENAGATVIRDTYGGDVGPHVAQTLWALRKEGVVDVANASEVDKAYVHGKKAYEMSEDAKAEIDALNVAIYEGTDRELMSLWRKCREVCLESFRELFTVLGTTFDYYFFESEVTPVGMEVVRDGVAKGVFVESDGAVIYEGEKKGLHTLVFITSRGTPTYETKDVGLAFHKEEHVPSDEVIIETGAEQVGHFKVFLAALSEIAPKVAEKMRHISHGLMTGPDGKKISSRTGSALTAMGLLADVVKRAQEKNEDPLVAEQVAVGALKYMILRQAAGGNIVFDPEKSLSLDGDSGPYLQYALVRARKILSYEGGKGGEETPLEPYAIERLIIRFPTVTARAARELAPHYIAQYLTQLASAWNSFYASEQVLGSAEEAYKQKVAKAFSNTMTSGLGLLGIPTPERM